MDADRSVNVLHPHLAAVAEGGLHPVCHAVGDDARDAKPAGFGQLFKPRGDVYAVAVEIIAIHQHVAEVDADARDDALMPGHLDRDGAAHRVQDTGELQQRAVADQLEDAPTMSGDRGVEGLGPETLQRGQRPGLVLRDHAGLSHDISREDRRKPAGGGRLAHESGS